MNPSADFRRSHKRSRRFPKIPRTLMKISGDHPNNSKDFWRSPEQFRRFLNFTRTSPKIPKDHLSTSEDWPNTSADFWRSPEDFWRSPKHFPGFPKTWDNLRRSPKITGYFRSFPKFRMIEGQVCFSSVTVVFLAKLYLIPHKLCN